MWPFGKKSQQNQSEQQDNVADTAAPAAAPLAEDPGQLPAADSVETATAMVDFNGERGPFDAEFSDPNQFDFADFAKARLNLGSVLLPIPHEGDIQVEMGPQGPTMLHIATEFGRVTPVAFAAPTSGGQWEESAREIHDGLRSDGLEVAIEQGPWGFEVVGRTGEMEMRILGADGPRWMLRMTASGPAAQARHLAHIARGVLARSFVTRGSDPMPAGQPLPVTLPAAMAEQIRAAYQQQTSNPGEVPGATGFSPNNS